MEIFLQKTDIIEGLKNMPDEVTIDELIDHFIFIEKVKKGLKSADQGRLTPHEEVIKMVDKWSK